MIQSNFIYFYNNYFINWLDLFDIYQTRMTKSGYNEILKCDLVYLEFKHKDSNGMVFRDAAGKEIHTNCKQDDFTKIGDRCLVPLSFKKYGDKIFPRTGVGYYKVSPGKLDYVNDLKISDNAVFGKRLVNLTDRLVFSVDNNDAELPDYFFEDYGLSRREVSMPNNVREYLDNLVLLDYNGKYKHSEVLEELDKETKSKRITEQSFDSRQSKVYIMTKDMKTIIKKTNAMVANHKSTQFGMSVLEFRQLENEKLFKLLEEIGYNRNEVCFARKEVGGIRACIDEEHKVEVRARFGEINIDDHQFKNDIRYLQDGSVIEKDENGVWWFVKEDEIQ